MEGESKIVEEVTKRVKKLQSVNRHIGDCFENIDYEVNLEKQIYGTIWTGLTGGFFC